MPLVLIVDAVGKVWVALPNDIRCIIHAHRRGNLAFHALRARWKTCEAGGSLQRSRDVLSACYCTQLRACSLTAHVALAGIPKAIYQASPVCGSVVFAVSGACAALWVGWRPDASVGHRHA